MDKRQIEIIAAPIVIIIAIIFVVSVVGKVSRTRPGKTSVVMKEGITPSLGSSGKEIVFKDSTFVPNQLSDFALKDKKTSEADIAQLPWGRDPFILDKAVLFSPGMDQDKASRYEVLSKLKLTGMIISEEDPKDSIAVINGENLKVGNTISGFILKEIRQDSVLFDWNNTEFELKLWEEEAQKGQVPANQQQ